MSAPFLIFPWDAPFLPHLQQTVCRLTHGRPGNGTIIVPHNRPRRYLTELFRQDASLPRPALLPRMLTIAEVVGLFRAETAAMPPRPARSLDQAALLYRCVRDVAREHGDGELCERLARMDMARFFPWGLRLAAVLEECLIQRRDARDIPYAEGEVSPLAAALLGALGRIQQRYLALLEEEGRTTPGLDARIAAQAVDQGAPIPALLRAREDRQVFIAGFAVLSGAENTLLRHLWRNGAHVCLHTDPASAEESDAPPRRHWACADHARWIREWEAPCAAVLAPSGREPRVFFTAGHDAHSQLEAARAVLERDAPGAAAPSTALVLTEPGLLPPVLHHLPDKDFNVSMGYPLERSPLCRLVEAILRLHMARRPGENADERPLYHWRALLHCLRHPYLRMLGGETGVLRDAFQVMEEALRGGARFADPHSLAEQAEENLSPSLRRLLRETLRLITDAFAAASTPNGMALALAALGDLLLRNGGDAWKRYPLDAESLFRLERHVIPELQGSALADAHLPRAALFSLTRQLLRAQRVPFEADPITGLQILGMLETRLLHFERVLILNATDDALPGFTAQDPLLPDALRALLGLPDARRRERTAAHTLYRLMAGAAEVHFFWQEGVQRSSLTGDKKTRSRFVDECVWREERRRRRLLTPGTPPLMVVPCPVHPMPRAHTGVPGGPGLTAAMRRLLARGVSPTRLDAYLLCPARFARENLLNLRPLEEVNEGDDPAGVGKLIHETLRAVYEPWLNRPLRAGAVTAEQLKASFASALNASPLRRQLPPDSYLMLAVAGPLRLARYLENQPEETRVLFVEHRLTAPLRGGACLLAGTLDRVDERSGELIVLDYKTGHVKRPDPGVWEDVGFWRRLELWLPGEENDPLPDLAGRMPSVQLSCYLHLCAANGLGVIRDAAWVRLRDAGEEVPLLGEAMDDDLRRTALEERIPGLLDFLTRHMENAAAYPPRAGDHCRHCPYADMCRRPA